MIKWLRRSSDSTRSVESTWVHCRHVGAPWGAEATEAVARKPEARLLATSKYGSRMVVIYIYYTILYIINIYIYIYTWIWKRILRPAWACIWNLLRIELGSALSRDKAAAGKTKKRKAGQIPCQRANIRWVVPWVSLKQLFDALGKLFGPIAVGLLCWYCRWNWPTD